MCSNNDGAPAFKHPVIKMNVLVVMAVKNRGQMAVEALTTVTNQTVKPTLISVVDDSSTDNSAATIRQFLDAHPDMPSRLSSISASNAAVARNHALFAHAHGMDAVAFLDSDDLWPNNFLERTSAGLDTMSDAIAVSTDKEVHNLDKGHRSPRCLKMITRNPILYMMKYGAGIGSCTLFRVDPILQLGGYPADFPTGHDVILFGRLALRGAWLHTPGAPVIYRKHYVQSRPGQETHINHKFPDHRLRWAQAHDLVWREAPPEVRRGLRLRRKLASRWAKAVKQLAREDRPRAWCCLKRALRIYPFSLKAWQQAIRLLTSRVSRHPIPSVGAGNHTVRDESQQIRPMRTYPTQGSCSSNGKL